MFYSMEAKETKFYNLFNEIGREFKKKISCVPENIDSDISIRNIQIIEFIGLEQKTMSEIAETFNLTPGSVTSVVDNMVDKKYLKRERNDDIDRRKVFISLAENGKKFHKHMVRAHKIAVISMLEDITEEDADKMVKLMQKMLEGLRNN